MNSRTSIVLAGLLTLPVALLLAGCVLLKDGATRLAFQIEDAATKMRRSNLEHLVIKHTPSALPAGPSGAYEIVLQSSLDRPRTGGALCVNDLGSQNFKNLGYNWATTYHLNFVQVPREMSVRKKAGEAAVLVLHKKGDLIEIESLH
jgi:hypothetical protein